VLHTAALLVRSVMMEKSSLAGVAPSAEGKE
jgi:hypothetical protein